MSKPQNDLMVLALKRAIVGTFDSDKWTELGCYAGINDQISNHPRLLRSLYWQDPDYSGCVFEILQQTANADPSAFKRVIDFVNPKEWLEKNDKNLLSKIYRGGLIPLDDIKEAADILDITEFNRHSKRILDSLDDDPEQAIGSTKELLESVFKAILGKHGHDAGKDDLPKLWSEVRKKLNLSPPENKMSGYEAYKKMLGSLNQIVDSICEIRGIHGTGHGRAKTEEPDKVEAKLVVNSGITLATYVLEKYLDVDVPF